MSDMFKNHSPGLSAPAGGAFDVTPDDTQALPYVTRAIYVGGEGNLRVTMVGGQTVTLAAVLPGAIYPLRCTHVLAAGTTTSNVVGLY